MIFQKVLKGVNGIDHPTTQQMVNDGISCNWWRKAGTITTAEKKLLLTADNLNLHLNHYHQPVPAGHPLARFGCSFGDASPFISTTAGAVARDRSKKTNIFFDPFITALRFATNQYRSKGFIFYAYLLTIGKQAIEMEQFSEEVRELHIYRNYSPYQTQGEIMAKIIIPSVQIEMAVEYDGIAVAAAFAAGNMPAPQHVITNTSYLPPERYSNIREVLV